MSSSEDTGFSAAEAQVVGMFMENVLYGMFPVMNVISFPRSCIVPGIFLISFLLCMKTLVWHDGYFKRAHLLNWPMILATITLLVFATLNASLSVRLNLEGFIYYGGDPSDWFNNMGNPIAIIKRVDYVGQTFMGDCILIYRCWVIHGRKVVVIFFPTLFLIAETVCGVMTVYTQAHLDPAEDIDSQLTPYLMSMLSLTLSTNVLTTSMIVYRLHEIHSAVADAILDRHPGTLVRVKVMMIESGLLYTMTTLIFFGMYVSSSNASSLMQDTIVQIIGITFNLIIVSALVMQLQRREALLVSLWDRAPLHSRQYQSSR
ncbi:hypothetical protein CPB85DRAFT_1434939 [Mucidula mucida]|nr:hypothetical protein CPB85DRAFT_1434939 [Mucidula mucida]